MNITHDIYTRYSKCLFGLPIVRNLLVKNSGLTTLYRPLGGLGIDRGDKRPGKIRVQDGEGLCGVVKPEFLTRGRAVAGRAVCRKWDTVHESSFLCKYPQTARHRFRLRPAHSKRPRTRRPEGASISACRRPGGLYATSPPKSTPTLGRFW